MNNLKIARRMKKMTQKEVAELIGVDRSTYTRYETGVVQPDNDKLRMISNILGVSIDFLLDRKPTTEGSENRRIPLLGRVPAGMPIEAIEDVEEYIDIYPRFVKHGELFALRVEGDSMEPDIHSGDIAIVEKQESIQNGEVAVVRVNGEDVTVKKVKRVSDGLMLIPNNPAYDPVFFSAAEVANLPVTIIGRVIEIRRRL